MTLAIIAGATLGLASSLHCVGMCGPLMSIFVQVNDKGAPLRRRLVLHHLGRVLTYLVLGLCVGAAGDALQIFKLGSSVSILTGTVLIVFAIGQYFGRSPHLPAPMADIMRRIGRFVTTSTAGTPPSFRPVTMGVINGLLPCGVSLTAIISSATIPDLATRAAFLSAFGAATVPALLGFGIVIRRLGRHWTARLNSGLAVATIVVGMLIIMRGLSLGVPLISPHIAVAEDVHVHSGCCGK
ncbi:MAG: sulfite exporter TauE/SafE family protein [Candidatus Kapabacteria bacterium]|nr:sulfite exporter TauE/SafE family protein [Candidatus Kapabacteria bacterium]